MARNEVKWGAVLSYLLIIVNAVYGLIITPYILSSIGDATYGVYKTISSLSSALMVLDLGLGGTVMRYVAKYRSENNRHKIDSFVSMAFGEASILIVLIAVASAALYASLPVVYAKGLSPEELALGQNLFVVMAINLMLHIVENVFFGIMSGFNCFTFANGMKLARILVRMALIYGVLYFVQNAIVLVLIDLFLTLLLIVIEMLYIRFFLHVRLRLSFKGWDKAVFKESFRYTALLFLTSIVAQVNNNLDNVVIGALRGSTLVAVYSMGLLLFGMFEHLSTSISGVMLPTVTNLLQEENGLQKVQKTIVQAGRIQFALLGAALVGFAVIGKQFICLWLGEGYEDVYTIALILMAPATLELCVNVCLSVLRAKNMLGFRTFVITAVTVVNAFITIVGVYFFGYIAAAIGTAFSFICGSVIVMNLYYHKRLAFPMLRIYREIFRGTWLCLFLAGGALFVASKWFFSGNGWMAFLLNVMVFVMVYAASMLLFGFNGKEKRSIPILNKIYK